MKRDKETPDDYVEQTRKEMADLLNEQENVGREFLIKDEQDKSGTISSPLHRPKKMITLELSPFLSLRSGQKGPLLFFAPPTTHIPFRTFIKVVGKNLRSLSIILVCRWLSCGLVLIFVVRECEYLVYLHSDLVTHTPHKFNDIQKCS